MSKQAKATKQGKSSKGTKAKGTKGNAAGKAATKPAKAVGSDAWRPSRRPPRTLGASR